MSSNLPIINITANNSCGADEGAPTSVASAASPHIIITTPGTNGDDKSDEGRLASVTSLGGAKLEIVTVLVEGEEVELDADGDVSKVGAVDKVEEVSPSVSGDEGGRSTRTSQVRHLLR